MRVEAPAQLVNAYLAKGQKSQALAICRQILERHPDQVALYPLLGKSLAAQGKLTEAISAYTKALALQPGQAEVHADLGQLYSQQQELAPAAWHYQQALAVQPNWAELHYNLAVVLEELGDWDGAIGSYGQALALKPDYAKAYFNLGVLYDQTGQLEAAIESYRCAIDCKPSYGRAYSNLGCALAKQEKLEAALAVYQQALESEPFWATLHNNLGQVLLARGEPDQALAAFRRAIELEPELALAHQNLGRLWWQQGNWTAATDCFRRALALEPDSVLAYSNCGSALIAQGKLEQAMEHFRQAIALQPTFVEAFCRRVELLEEKDLLDRAKVCCARFLRALQQRLDTSEVCHHLWQTYLYLGDVLFEYGGVKQAEVYYQKGLQVKPDAVDLYLRLGNCLAKQERPEAAAIVYHTGLTIQPSHPQILFELGNLLEKQKRLGQAIGYYEAVLQMQLDGEIDKGGKSLSVTPSHSKLPKLPKGIYPFTQDWAIASGLEGCHYVEVSWTQESKGKKSERERLPEAVLEPFSGQKQSQPNCGGVTCTTCMNRLCSWFEPLQLAKGVYFCSRQSALPVESPPTFVATIPQGRAWIAPQKSSWIICHAIAIVSPDNYLLGDLSRDYPWYLPGCSEHDPTRHRIFSLEELPPLEEIDGTVAVLSGLSGHVYYHWMIDVLPRIGILGRSGIDLTQIDWFVVNSVRRPFQWQTLNALGIPAKKIIESDRHPHLQAKQLVVPSFPGHLDWVPWGTTEFLRQAFAPGETLKTSDYPERIYISRAKASYRQVLNQGEVTDLLSQFGFVSVVLEVMSVAEQIALFACARAIVAPHGAGLTNLVFCQSGTKVIEIFSPNYLRTDYWMISQQLKLKHYYLKGESFECYPIRQLMDQNSLTEDILVNLSSLRAALEVAGLAD